MTRSRTRTNARLGSLLSFVLVVFLVLVFYQAKICLRGLRSLLLDEFQI
jgi:hypothetical protein